MARNMGTQVSTTEEILSALREAALFETRERVNAPIEAKAAAQERIDRATAEKMRLVVEARQAGATLSSIAAQLGIRNQTHVSKMLKDWSAST